MNRKRLPAESVVPRCVCGHRDSAHFGLNKRLGDCCNCHCWEFRPAQRDDPGVEQ